MIRFCRSVALVHQQVGLSELLAGPFQSVVRKDPVAVALCQPVVVAHWRNRWCDAVVLVEDGTLAIARAESSGKVRLNPTATPPPPHRRGAALRGWTRPALRG